MSLLGGMTGDIWSTGAFSFESPLKDLLESDDYTFEQLLAEDELLQELRGVHPQLIEYFSTEESVTKLVQYVILPPDAPPPGESFPASPKNEPQQQQQQRQASPSSSSAAPREHINGLNENVASEQQQKGDETEKQKDPGQWLLENATSPSDEEGGDKSASGKTKRPQDDPETLHIRFPYMACEIICCEIKVVIDTLVDGNVVGDFSSDGVESEILTTEHGDLQGGVEVVDPRPRRILDLLFSVLYKTEIGKMDDYRAGYFDKILTVLFRKRPKELGAYISDGGRRGQTALMTAMLNHLYSHSIMQIAQRLLLPQRPTPRAAASAEQPKPEEGVQQEEGGTENIVPPEQQQQQQQQQQEEEEEDEEANTVQSTWSGSKEALDILMESLIGPTDIQAQSVEEEERRLSLSQNASEVLITIIQNSMLSSPTMFTFTSAPIVDKLIAAATTVPVQYGSDPTEEYFSPHESVQTSAMNVLESLILQLGGYGAVGTMTILPEDQQQLQSPTEDVSTPSDGLAASSSDDSAEDAPDDERQESQNNNNSNNISGASDPSEESSIPLIADLTVLLERLPGLLEKLAGLMRHPSTAKWTSPTQFSLNEPRQLLGTSRLKIVRVLESLVLLGDPEVDSRLVQSSCLEICLDLFWEFQWCSMLHQSVANLLVHVFEGQNARFEMQDYFLVRCNLLGRLMDSFMEVQDSPRLAEVVMNMKDVAVESGGGETASEDNALPVSEDDVDAAMEQQQEASAAAAALSSIEKSEDAPDDEAAAASAALGEEPPPVQVAKEVADPSSESDAAAKDAEAANEIVSTEAVKFESRDTSILGVGAPAQSFRLGYMGHVIIICQALVHACTVDMDAPGDDQVPMDEGGEAVLQVQQSQSESGTNGELLRGDSDVEEQGGSSRDSVEIRSDDSCPTGDERELLFLAELVNDHPLRDRWHDFITSTLASETAVQSTPLGGYATPGQPGTAADPLHAHRPGLADEGDLVSDEVSPPLPPRGMLGGGEVIDMDDNDLDIAATMMASLSLGRPPTAPTAGSASDDDDSGGSGSAYSGSADSDTCVSGEPTSEGNARKPQKRGSSVEDEDDNDSHSSSDEEPEVQDLFVAQPEEQPAAEAPEWGGFAAFDANFDDAFAGAADSAGAADGAPAQVTEEAKPSDDDDEFGPFASATAPTEDFPPDEDNKKPAIDDIFGAEGDASAKGSQIDEIFGADDAGAKSTGFNDEIFGTTTKNAGFDDDFFGGGSEPKSTGTGDFFGAGDGAGFPVAQVGDDAGFPAAQAGDGAGFPAAQAGDDAGFPAAQVGDDAGFPAAPMGDDAGFPPTQMGDDAGFPAAQVGDDAGFPAAQVGDDAGFPVAQVGDDAGFPVSQEKDDAGFPVAQAKDEAGFPVAQVEPPKESAPETNVPAVNASFSDDAPPKEDTTQTGESVVDDEPPSLVDAPSDEISQDMNIPEDVPEEVPEDELQLDSQLASEAQAATEGGGEAEQQDKEVPENGKREEEVQRN